MNGEHCGHERFHYSAFVQNLTDSADTPYRILRITVFALLLSTACRLPFALAYETQSPVLLRHDFLAIYLLPKAISSGTNPYESVDCLIEKFIGPLTTQFYPHPTPHTPTLGLLLLPLSILDYKSARLTWLSIQIASLSVAAALGLAASGCRITAARLVAVQTTLLLFGPAMHDLVHGNMHSVMLALLCLAWFSASRNRPEFFGIAVAVLILIKQVMFPVLLLSVVTRDRRALVASITTVLAGYITTIYVVGADAVLFYFTEALPSATSKHMYATENFSLWTIGPRLFLGMQENQGFSHSSCPFIYSERLAQLLMFAIPTTLMCISVYCVSCIKDLHFRFSYVCGLVVVVSPLVWGYYFLFAAIPISYGWLRLSRLRYPLQETACMVIACALIARPYALWQVGFEGTLSPWASLLMLAPSVGVLALLWLMVRLDRKSVEQGEPGSTFRQPYTN